MQRLIVVGGGLFGALIALANAPSRDRRQVILVEERPRFGGGPQQPFLADDLPPGGIELVDDLVVREWPGFLMLLPDGEGDDAGTHLVERRLMVLAPEQVHVELSLALPPDDLLCGCPPPVVLSATAVEVGDQRIEGDAVLDLRNVLAGADGGRIFVDVGSHMPDLPLDLSRPVLLDATVGTAGAGGALQYVPMADGWLVMRRLRFCRDGAAAREAIAGPAAGSHGARRIVFPFASPDLAIPAPVPHPLAPSEVPAAVALGLAIASSPDVSQQALAALREQHAAAGAARLAALDLLAQAPPERLGAALLLAAGL